MERLGDLLLRLGRFAEAQARIEELAEAAPRNAAVWMKLGVVYYEQKLWDRASDAFRRALALEPTNMRARYFLATTYMDGGSDAEARAELERILQADPRSIDARVQLGFLHGRAKRYDEAIAVLREAVNLEPKRPELFLYLGTAYFRAKQYDRAVATLKEGLGSTASIRTCTSSSAWSTRSRPTSRAPSAVPQRHHRRSPPRRGLQLRRVHVRREGQNLDEAVQLIAKALEIEPENGYFIDSLGWAYYQQGRYPEALRELQRAVERAKDDPVIFDHLGDAYAKNG